MKNEEPRMLTEQDIRTWLEAVKDPEIPVLSLNDLGVIRDISIENSRVAVTITPTFVGCPALEIMKDEIRSVLNRNGIDEVTISVTFSKPWTTADISEKGKKALKSFGLAPPPATILIDDLDILQQTHCPRCNGTNTEMRSPFGPTLCRSIHYCFDCREAYEQFKPL